MLTQQRVTDPYPPSPRTPVRSDVQWRCACGATGEHTTRENSALEWLAHHRIHHAGRITNWQLLTAIGNPA